jgi:hypothetical protein
MRAMLLLGLCPVLLVPAAALATHVIWWEAEAPARTNFPRRTWFSPQNAAERDVLSAKAWITSDGERKGPPLFLEYKVRTRAAGRYAFWCRKFWKHGPFRWRFGEGPWHTCGRDVALADSVQLRKFVCANWVCLGQLALNAGDHSLRIELLAGPGDKATSAFDSFVLAAGPFVPRGKLKPGDKLGRAPEGWFPFEPDLDSFDRAALDLRSLNEKMAG